MVTFLSAKMRGGASDSPPLFSEGAAAPWPAADLCEEQLYELEAEMRPAGGAAPRVLFHLFSNNGFMLYARLMRHLHDRHGADGYASATAAIKGVIFDSTPDPSYDPPLLKQVAVASVASVLKKEPVPGMTIRDLGMRTPLRAVVHAACHHAQDPVFDSTWHYDWLRQHEPRVPCLFVYSVTDRTIRQEQIEEWMRSNKPSWGSRRVETLLLDGTGHVEAFWKARPRYVAALSGLIDSVAW